MHSLAFWNLLINIATFLILGAAGVAAIVQIRHMWAFNQIEAVFVFERDFRDPQLQSAFHYVQNELNKRLEDDAYRGELAARGIVDSAKHPEMLVCNWFNQVGTMVKNGLVEEEAFLDSFSRVVDHNWALLAPAIAVLRRTRGPEQYHKFEYLAVRSREWHKKYPYGRYPKDEARMQLDDKWLARDSQR
jgi:hypothetical protein